MGDALRYTRQQLQQLGRENDAWPEALTPIPGEQWLPLAVHMTDPPIAAYRSRTFLVQIYRPRNGAQRMSVNRTTVHAERWRDGISWDDLQRLKREAGFADRVAVEFFPPDDDVVNVANMRHLFILDEPLPCMWSSKEEPRDG